MSPIIPVEIGELIYEHLDIVSLCALSQSCLFHRYDISERLYQKGLQAVCPWFQPRYSHRKTWRECAVEYCRRVKPHARLGPGSFQRVSPGKFGSTPILIEEEKMHGRASDEKGGVLEKDSQVLKYTSEHGISIAFKLETGMTEQHFDVVSFPQVLIAYRSFFGRQDLRLVFRTTVAVKYLDSAEPSFFYFKNTCVPEPHIQGSQVFLTLRQDFHGVYDNSDNALIIYLDIDSKNTMVFRYKHLFNTLAKLMDYELFFVCYDGLFYEFNDKGKHRISQANTEGVVTFQGSSTPEKVEYHCTHPINFQTLVERHKPTLDNYRYVSFACDQTSCPRVMVDLALGRCTLGNRVDGVTSAIDTFPLIYPSRRKSTPAQRDVPLQYSYS